MYIPLVVRDTSNVLCSFVRKLWSTVVFLSPAESAGVPAWNMIQYLHSYVCLMFFQHSAFVSSAEDDFLPLIQVNFFVPTEMPWVSA